MFIETVQEAYVALGVPYGSSEEITRKAYRRLISAWHPDRNDSDEAHEKTLIFNAAISILEKNGFKAEESDYDRSFRFNDAWPGHSDTHAYDHWSHGFYEDPFKAARTINRKVRLTIEEAAFGCIQSLKGKTSDVCRVCNGTKVSGELEHCNTCNGSGIHFRSRGWDYARTTCPSCGGRGSRYRSCKACEGTGHQRGRSYAFRVNIPPGVRNNDSLTARGVGGLASDRKTRADARITIEIKPHSVFSFDDRDCLYIKVPVFLTEFVRGATITVPTLYGPQKLLLRPQQFDYMMLGFGFPDRNGEPGNLHVHITVAIPSFLDDEMVLFWKSIERQLLLRGDTEYEDTSREREALLRYRVTNETQGKS